MSDPFVPQMPEIEFEDESVTPTNWEFIGVVPTLDDVTALLKTLDPVWGIRTSEYAEFVVGLPSSKKTNRRDDRGRKVEEYVDVVTLYMSVAGRLKMINDAAEKHGWTMSFVPESVTPTGVPGYLQMEQRIVYREYVVISTDDGRMLGSKPGTAWVPASGGKQAAGSNPYEKVETAARGRGIAAWGFGVLPGSGVASLEEMQAVRGNAAAIEAEPTAPQQRMSRAELIATVMTLSEEVRQERAVEPQQQMERLADYAKSAFGVEIAVEEGGEEGPEIVRVDLSKLKDGQLTLMANQLADTLKRIRSNTANV